MALSDTELAALIGRLLGDNETGEITPEDLRDVLLELLRAQVTPEQLSAYAPLNSPVLQGVPQVPTAAPGTANTQAASTGFVQQVLAGLAGNKNLSELALPQAVVAGNWYVTPGGLWEARRSFAAAADPTSGPNWRQVASFTGPPLTVSSLTDASAAGRRLLTAPSAAAQRALLGNPGIVAGQYGNHPSFSTEDGDDGVLAWLLKGVAAAKAPDAPTNGQVNDVSKEFSFTVNPLFASYSQYKVTGLPGTSGAVALGASTAYQVNNTVFIRVGSAVAKGNLAVCVAGSGSRPDGAVLTNADAFTGTLVVVTPPATTALTVSLAIAVASIMAGNPLTFTVTGGGGTGPYTYAVVATNTVTGASFSLGSATSGSWTPVTAGDYELTAAITDATGASKISLVRPLHVSYPPVANAGSDTVLTQPQSSVQLQGSGYEQAYPGQFTYSWSQSPGDPANVSFSSKYVAQPTVSGLTAVGVYHFQLIVTDALGNVSLADEVVVTVQAASTTPTFSLVVDSQRNLTLTLPSGADPADYEYQIRPVPTISSQRVIDLTNFLADGESASDYEYQIRPV